MHFGFMFFARDLAHAVGSTARLAEAHGYDLLGIGDSPSLAHDPFLGLAIAAQNTSRIRLGTTVTNFTASPDLPRYVRSFGEEVLPAFRAPTGRD